MPNVGGRAVGRLTQEKFEKLANARKLNAWSLLWRTFWKLADDGSGAVTVDQQHRFAEEHPRAHFRWRGQVDKRGRCVFRAHPQAPELPASTIAWLWEYEGLPEGELRVGDTLKPKCGRKDCIRPDHFEVVRAAR